jgi:prophage regulatory protein
MKITRIEGVQQIYPRGKSTIYADVAAGLLPPPISLGPRCSVWIKDEITAVVAARIAGASDPGIKQLVGQLVGARPKRPTIDAA